MIDHPLVSIVVPTYNVESYIAATITSVLRQTYGSFELLLIDDCSTDTTVDIINSFTDPRIRLIRNARNSGAGITRTTGLQMAKGRYIALLDSDDLWYPEKLTMQISFMQQTGAAATYTRYDIIDDLGNVYMDSGSLPSTVNYQRLLRHCYIRTSSLVYDASAVGRDITFADIKRRQDYVFFLDILKRIGEAKLVDHITCSYRIHSRSVSSSKFKNIPYQWAAYRHCQGLSLPHCTLLMGNWFLRSGFVVIKRKATAKMNALG